MKIPTRRLFSALIAPFAGYLVFSVGAWKVGPMIGVQGRGLGFLRGGLLVLGALVAMLVGLFLVRRARKKARGAAADEIDAVFKVAAQRLATAKGVSVRSLRDLPLILVLGPEGSAKTTTVLQAGLDPDILAGEPLQGAVVAPTKHANLWYAHGVVMAEVGGKILGNPDAWEHLATRLRPKRFGAVFAGKTQAPRAALLCFSCEDLVNDDQEKVKAAVGVLRDRLSVASRTLGIRLPVYVVFTKADRIRSFPEFVRDLNSEETQHALGVTMPLSPPTDLGAYATREFDRLSAATESILSSLALQRMRILPRIAEQDERNAAYEFPRELRKLTPRVIEFLVELCRPRHLDMSPFVRGLYFAGVRPVVVDAPTAGAAPKRVPQWLFLTGLFHDVVRRDHVALGVTQSGHGIKRLRRLAFGSLTALALLLVVGTSFSFLSNRRLTNRVIAAAEAVTRLSDDAPMPQALSAMDGLRKELVVLLPPVSNGPPLRRRWGLYRGDEVAAHGRRIYWGEFQQRLLRGIRDSVETELRVVTANPAGVAPDSAIAAVARYLRVTSRPDKLTPDSAAALIDRSENRLLVGSDRDLALEQLRFYGGSLCAGDGLCQQELDLTLATRACGTLSSFDDTEPRYNALLERVGSNIQTVRIGTRVLQPGPDVPAHYTRAAWQEAHKLFNTGDLSAGGENWVYQGIQCQAAEQRDVPALTRTLHQRYDSSYVRHWRDYLRLTRISIPGGAENASAALKSLGDFRSPLLEMLALVSNNTSSGGDSIVLADSMLLLNAFQPAHMVVPPARGSVFLTDANRPYANALAALGDALKSAAASDDQAAVADAVSTAKQAAQQLTSSFSASAGEVGGSVKSLLESPLNQIEGLVERLPGQRVNDAIRQFCSALGRVTSLFPFNPNGPNATPQDVASIFHPGSGELTKLAEALQSVLEKRGNEYQRIGTANPVPRTFVEFFNRAMGVSATLFSPDGKGPRLDFVMRLSPPAEASDVILTLDGQTLSRARNDNRSQQFNGISQDMRAASASLRLTVSGRPVTLLDFPGPWGNFKLFGRATWTESSSGAYRLTWNETAEGRAYVVNGEINPTGVPILDRAYLSSLRCPR